MIALALQLGLAQSTGQLWDAVGSSYGMLWGAAMAAAGSPSGVLVEACPQFVTGVVALPNPWFEGLEYLL